MEHIGIRLLFLVFASIFFYFVAVVFRCFFLSSEQFSFPTRSHTTYVCTHTRTRGRTDWHKDAWRHAYSHAHSHAYMHIFTNACTWSALASTQAHVQTKQSFRSIPASSVPGHLDCLFVAKALLTGFRIKWILFPYPIQPFFQLCPSVNHGFFYPCIIRVNMILFFHSWLC